MGEYAKYNYEEIKIGTCDNMYYLRYEDRDKVQAIPGNANPARDLGLRFRLPYPDEDNIEPGHYQEYNRGYRLYKKDEEADYYTDFPAEDLTDNRGTIQLSHPSGLLINVPCHHGAKLPDIDGAKVFWNGKSWSIELAFVKVTEDGVLPIIQCRHCQKMWSCTWDEILPYLHGEMRTRLEKHAV